jgi:hypothetical protein
LAQRNVQSQGWIIFSGLQSVIIGGAAGPESAAPLPLSFTPASLALRGSGGRRLRQGQSNRIPNVLRVGSLPEGGAAGGLGLGAFRAVTAVDFIARSSAVGGASGQGQSGTRNYD